MAVLDGDDLVGALEAGGDSLSVFVADVVAGLEDLGALAPTGVGAAGVRELEGRGAPELEQDLHLAALVDVHLDHAPLADPHARHRVDRLRQLHCRPAVARPVAYARDGEVSRSLCYAPEVRRRRLRLLLHPVELVVHLERRRARERVRDALAHAVVGSLLQGVDGRRVVELDLHRRATHVGLGLAAAGVAHVADPDLLDAELEVLAGDLDAVRVGGDVGDPEDLGEGTGVVLDLDLHVERRHAFQVDGDALLLVLLRHAHLQRLSRLGEGDRRLCVDRLLQYERRRLALVVVVEVI